MVLYDNLPKDGALVVIPIGMKQGEHYEPGYVDPTWLSQAFADFINKEVPLSETEYQALLDASTDLWKLNWQEFRKQGLI